MATVLRSREGYSDGKCEIPVVSVKTYDIEKDGVVIGEITSSKLRQYLYRCAKNGRPPKYSNVRDMEIIDPDYKPKQTLCVFGVRRSGEYFIRDKGVVTCKRTKHGAGYDFGFEFESGFVIGVHSFVVQEYGPEFSSVEFKIFDVRETFGLDGDFLLLIEISDFDATHVSGEIYTQSEDSERGNASQSKLGDFELYRDRTVYKGVESKKVYDKSRFAKELMLGG